MLPGVGTRRRGRGVVLPELGSHLITQRSAIDKSFGREEEGVTTSERGTTLNKSTGVEAPA